MPGTRVSRTPTGLSSTEGVLPLNNNSVTMRTSQERFEICSNAETAEASRAPMKKKKRTHPKPGSVQGAAWVESLPLQAAALALLVLAAYWNSLDGGFHFDDQGIFL